MIYFINICLFFSYIWFSIEIKKQTEGNFEFNLLEFEKQKFIDSIAEEEKKQIEKEQQELKEKLEADELKDSETLFNKIYEGNIGSKVVFLIYLNSSLYNYKYIFNNIKL